MIRRNFLDLSNAERDRLAAAFNYVNEINLISSQAIAHENFFNRGIHWRPQFLPWHRYFLRRLELALQQFDSSVMLPYWDWTRSDSRNIDRGEWERIFGGRNNSGGKFDRGWRYVRNRTANGWSLPSLDHVIVELEADNFGDFRKIEGRNNGRIGSHVNAHAWVGGNMSSGDSPLDPLFYLHHSNIDRLWSIWQINNARRPQYDSLTRIESDRRTSTAPYIRINDNMPDVTNSPRNPAGFSGPTPNNMLNHRALGFFSPRGGYGYSRDSVLEAAWRRKHGTGLITGSTPEIVGAGV